VRDAGKYSITIVRASVCTVILVTMRFTKKKKKIYGDQIEEDDIGWACSTH